MLMKVPFFVKKIVREDVFSTNVARFHIYLIDGRKIYCEVALEYLNSWPDETALESYLWNQIFFGLKTDAKDMDIEIYEDPYGPNWKASSWTTNIGVDFAPKKASFSTASQSATVDYLSLAAIKNHSEQSLGATVSDTMNKLVPGLNAMVKCPGQKDCSHGRTRLENIIIYLNDVHKWTREAIADWLDSLDLDLEFKEQDAKQD